MLGYRAIPDGTYVDEEIVNVKDGWRRREEYKRRMNRIRLTTQELRALTTAGETLILVDDDEWGPEVIAGRRAIPFAERYGQYWGNPLDDQAAIEELERMRQCGAQFHGLWMASVLVVRLLLSFLRLSPVEVSLRAGKRSGRSI